MAQLKDYLDQGQSIWLDDIRRSYFTSGELNRLVKLGLRGLTSNPSIFEKAIVGSNDYDADLARLVKEGKSVEEIYETLTIEDIRRAADGLHSVYIESDGADGFVSLEVSPTLANDSAGTVQEAIRLFSKVDRPNLMIKIPATPAGIQAIQTVLSQGVNVNATLIFSLSQYEAVAQAHLAGLEQRLASGEDISKVASVASFFVSRVDSEVDKLLESRGESALLGKIAIANCRVAYARFQELYTNARWQRLAARSARVQRPLWASTSAKNPAYSDTLYVDELIGPDTVNTLPFATIQAALNHGKVERSVDRDIAIARDQIARLDFLRIDLESITQKLQQDGVAAFQKSFDSLMESISRKREKIRAAGLSLTASLGQIQEQVDAALTEMEEKRLIQRIWEGDHSVWKPDPTEITNRLGWLRIDETMLKAVSQIEALVHAARDEGFTHALLLGMGGSSLAPEVFRTTFGVQAGYLDLAVLDSTDPEAVLEYASRLDPSKTLYIVSTKSGGTIETASFFKYFYTLAVQSLGAEQAGAHFIAITDPGSQVAQTASKLNFRATFLNDPNIGGRYSALSYFGLAPAALVGIDLGVLLRRATGMADHCASIPAARNNGARLGAIMAEMARSGRDKLTLITSSQISTFGDWVEQLVAESTGKDGQGILPVVGEVIAEPAVYGDDRLFIYLHLAGNHEFDVQVRALEEAGHPVVRIEIEDFYDLGGQFFLWEFATAVASSLLGIQPFDQPNVESAKVQARKMIAAYQEQGNLPELTPVLQADGVKVYGDIIGNSLDEVWDNFLAKAKPGAYIAIQAYIPPSAASDASLLGLRTELRARTGLAVTSGYGPRFLHSTGQLHKGDAGKGLFVQITCDDLEDAPIPDEACKKKSSVSFKALKNAQSLGDRQALLDNQREVLRFQLGADLQVGFRRLTQAL